MGLTEHIDECYKKFNKASMIITKEQKAKDIIHENKKLKSTITLLGNIEKKCNDMMRIPDKVPIFFHNLKRYDSKFILEKIGSFINDSRRNNVIALSIEKFLKIDFDGIYYFVD